MVLMKKGVGELYNYKGRGSHSLALLQEFLLLFTHTHSHRAWIGLRNWAFGYIPTDWMHYMKGLGYPFLLFAMGIRMRKIMRGRRVV
jgi:hypothetical protein